jgi:hypothetical protein
MKSWAHYSLFGKVTICSLPSAAKSTEKKFVFIGDVENFIRISKYTYQATTTSSEKYLPVLSKIYSENHIEHDIYFMFEKV